MSRPVTKVCKKCGPERQAIGNFYKKASRYCIRHERELANNWHARKKELAISKVIDRKDMQQDLQELDIARMERLACLPDTPKSLISKLISMTDDYFATKQKGFTNLSYLR